MTAEHGLQAAYVRGARGRRMRPVLIAGQPRRRRGCRRGPTASLPQARSSWSTAARRCSASRCRRRRSNGRRALTATALARRRSPIRGSIRRSTGCSTRSRRRRRRAAGARRWSATNCCCSPSSASGSTSRRCAVSGAQRRPGRGQPEIGPGGQRRRGRALCRQAAAAAALRPRGRARPSWPDIARRAGADRPFPDARRADRPRRAGARRSARAAGRAPAPGRRADLADCLRGARSPSVSIVTGRHARHAVPECRDDRATSRCASRSAISPSSPTRRPSRWFWSYHVRIENGVEARGPIAVAQLADRRRARHASTRCTAKAWSAKCR